jgi:protein-tyrosine-phosphatase
MTAVHRSRLLEFDPSLGSKVELLDPAGGDIADPYGGSSDDYRRSRDQIAAALSRRFGEWRH